MMGRIRHEQEFQTFVKQTFIFSTIRSREMFTLVSGLQCEAEVTDVTVHDVCEVSQWWLRWLTVYDVCEVSQWRLTVNDVCEVSQ